MLDMAGDAVSMLEALHWRWETKALVTAGEAGRNERRETFGTSDICILVNPSCSHEP